jgi:DNA polymerase (family 10)
MTKNEIADVLNEIGVLLELKGENPFKIRAYQTGARALEAIEEAELSRLIRDGGLGDIKGFGEALVQKITELHTTGRLEFHEKLKASIEPGLVEMLQIPGLGPKKIRALHDKLGIADIAALAAACADGRVAELDGFGVKSQEKILAGIQHREAYGKRHLWWEAQEVAEPILAGLRALPAVERAEAAGSLRRGMETIGDLDFLVAAADSAPVVAWFVAQPGVQEVTAQGETKASVRFTGGLQADLRIVPADQFVFALHHFTGSKDHNVQMRQRALARGLSLSEWGLVPAEGEGTAKEKAATSDKGERKPAAKTEEDLFAGARALGFHPAGVARRAGRDRGGGVRGVAGAGPSSGPARGVSQPHDRLRRPQHAGRDDRGGRGAGLGLPRDRGSFEGQFPGQRPERGAAARADRRDPGVECNEAPPDACVCRRGVRHPRDGRMDYDDALLGELDYVVVSVHNAMTQDEATMTARSSGPSSIPRRPCSGT